MKPEPDKPIIWEEERRLTWMEKLLIGAGCLGLFITAYLTMFQILYWIGGMGG